MTDVKTWSRWAGPQKTPLWIREARPRARGGGAQARFLQSSVAPPREALGHLVLYLKWVF